MMPTRQTLGVAALLLGGLAGCGSGGPQSKCAAGPEDTYKELSG
jgi:hypothetical protein